MRIETYKPEYKKEFIVMNKNWISEMFTIEPDDLRELDNIEAYIESGGNFFSH